MMASSMAAEGNATASRVIRYCPCTHTQQDMAQGCPRCATERLPLHISECVMHRAIQMFLGEMVIPTPNAGAISHGHFSSIFVFYETSGMHALHTALEAVALALYSIRINLPQLRSQAMHRYTRSIQGLASTDLSSKSMSLKAIACMALLGLYEVAHHCACCK